MKEFLMNNAGFIWSLVTMVVLFGGTFFAIPFAQKRGWLTQSRIDEVERVLDLANVALQNLKLSAGATLITTTILKATEAAVNYVEQTMKWEGNDAKLQHAKDAAIQFLQQEGIEVTDEMKKLIEVGLESAVKSLPKTNS